MKLSTMKSLDYYVGNLFIFFLRPISLLVGKLLRRDHSLTVKDKIVVFKILGGGSIVMAYPALMAIKKKYPNSKLLLVCGSSIKSYAEILNVFDEIIVVKTDRVLPLIFSSLNALAKSLVADCFINLELHSRLSGVFSLFSCSRNRFSFYMVWSRWQYGITTHAFFYNGTSPIYEGYNQMAAALGADIDRPDRYVLEYRQKHEFALSSKHTVPSGKLVALAPFCSDLGPERMFSPIEWVNIFKHRYGGEKLNVLLLGGPSDLIRSKDFVDAFAFDGSKFSIVNLVGNTSLLDAVAFMKIASEVLTIDSGLNHLARLLGLPLTSYWGPTDPFSRLAAYPMNSREEEVIYRKIPCSPCVHVTDVAPCRGENVCMKQYLPNIEIQIPKAGWVIESLNEGLKL